MTLATIITALGGWTGALQLLLGLPAFVGAITVAWKQFMANKNAKTALAAANQTAAASMAALEMVPASPAVAQIKQVIKAIQEKTGLELQKQSSLLTATRQVVASVGLGDPKANETEANNITDVATAIMKSETIRANRAGISFELPTIGGK